MANYERRNFETSIRVNTPVIVDGNVIPTLKNNEKFQITMARFQDHGRPCFVAHALKSNSTFLELGRSLTDEERRKVDVKFTQEVEKILDGDESRKVATWTAQGKPDIHMLFIGEPFDPKSLRLYYTRGVFNNAPAIYQLAVSRLKDSARVEKIFENTGYTGSKNWEKRKIH